MPPSWWLEFRARVMKIGSIKVKGRAEWSVPDDRILRF